MTFELVKGQYKKEDALLIIEGLFKAKMAYHENKIQQSDNEEDINMREQRIKKLQDEFATYRNYLQTQTDHVPLLVSVNV